MIPDWAIQQIMEDERTIEEALEKRNEFRSYEPEAADWMDMLIKNDLEKLTGLFQDLYKAYPKIEKTFYFMLWKSLLRGWAIGEAKWKCNTYSLPGESGERNPSHYLPDNKDFI